MDDTTKALDALRLRFVTAPRELDARDEYLSSKTTWSASPKVFDDLTEQFLRPDSLKLLPIEDDSTFNSDWKAEKQNPVGARICLGSLMMHCAECGHRVQVDVFANVIVDRAGVETPIPLSDRRLRSYCANGHSPNETTLAVVATRLVEGREKNKLLERSSSYDRARMKVQGRAVLEDHFDGDAQQAAASPETATR